MQNINTSRYLECLIGLECYAGGGHSRFLIIDISPTHSLVLLANDGRLTYSSASQIRLTEESQNMLCEKIVNQNREALK